MTMTTTDITKTLIVVMSDKNCQYRMVAMIMSMTMTMTNDEHNGQPYCQYRMVAMRMLMIMTMMMTVLIMLENHIANTRWWGKS